MIPVREVITMKCPSCGGHNPDYRRKCEYCAAILERPLLTADQVKLRDQFLSMSLGAQDLSTIAFALNIDWHEMEEEEREADKVEMLVRMLADEGRVDEVAHSLRDFKFPQSYPPLPAPYPDNPYLTYVFAVQNITAMAQLEEMCDRAGIGEAQTLSGDTLPHKIREALRLASRYNKLTYVHEWLRGLKPQEGLKRPDRRRRRR
jgi:hypothetical protein